MDNSGVPRATLGKRGKVLAALLAVCLVTSGALNIHERSQRRSAGRIMESVVAIGDAAHTHGGGVVLKGGRYILTVNHVIEGMVAKRQGIVVTYRDGSMAPAAIVKRNRHFDIALLEVEDSRARGLSLGDESSLQQGDHVRAFGHPFGIQWMMSDGIVSRKSYFPPGINGNRFIIWTTAWIEQGNSGGPLVNDEGEIVGLVMAFMNPRGAILGAQHINLCVSPSEIKRFLEN